MINSSISIIIPVYNSETTIEKLVDQLIFEFANQHLEIVLINDCSSDSSEEVCINLHIKYPRQVHFFSLAKNVGEHNAVMAGLTNCSGEIAIIMDDDFQNPISEVHAIIRELENEDVDVVYTYYDKKEHHFFRNLGSKFNDRVANVMLQKPKNLYLSSFKGLNRFLINEVIKYNLPFPYLDGLILRSTSKIGSIKVTHNKREEGKSGYTLRKLVSLWSNMFVNFSILPLRISIYIGFLSAIFGFIFAVFSIIEKIENPKLPIGYTLTIITISIFSGLILISIGMCGEYIGRMFLSQNKTPQFVIRKKFISHE
jgi:glycosyltransferase involved in cell wall biosynthesis